MTPRTLTTREVAERLRCAPNTVSEHAKAGRIPGAFKPFGKGWRFDTDVFEAWVQSKASRDTWAKPSRKRISS